jgi:hypothetical protein
MANLDGMEVEKFYHETHHDDHDHGGSVKIAQH